MNVKINIKNENITIPEELLQVTNGDELLAHIFYNRGITDAGSVRQMLYEESYEPTRVSEFPDMDKAVEIISAHIISRSPIAVYGDYDVDGVTSTALLLQCIRNFSSKVIYHVPDRFSEGYGMNAGVIRDLAAKGIKLIVTCDCGISNMEEIKLAKELGMEVVVTDHHNLPDVLPPADVLLNPKLLPEGHKARDISGCAMAYFLSLAILQHYGREKEAGEYLDLIALSLVADVVNLRGENRHLLKKAIPKLFNTKRPGLTELFAIIEKNGKMHNEEDIAFQIAPRINAAGRMDTARLPVELLICSDFERARTIAQKIDLLNKERKRIQQDIIEQAVELVESYKKNKTVLVLYRESWHHGIIGIAAGKVCETYGKPAILLSLKDDGSTIVGSARSIEEIDIFQLIKECSSKLLKFGGHSQAAGLSLRREDLESFSQEIERVAEEKYFIRNEKQINVDAELALKAVDEELYERLRRIGPYGEGFEAPEFLTRGVSVVSDRRTDKNHHIMVLAGENDYRMQAVKWFGDDSDYSGKVLDITYKIGRNTYRENDHLQITLDHFDETSGKAQEAFSGCFADERGSSIHDVLARYDKPVIFYEGMQSDCPLENTYDRNRISAGCKNSTLVFLSTPANTKILREAIALVNPKTAVINFSVLPDYSFKSFIMNFMGIVKYVVAKENGRTKLEVLSSRMCVEESMIRAVLKYLKALGKLEFSIEENETSLFPCSKKPDSNYISIENSLKNALLEKNAYQKFILKLEIDKFMEYMK